jgi:FixJ family two-component response regulator
MSASATVFVVDDDASFRQAIARLVRTEGYEVEAFSSAASLLERMRVGPIPAGCVLADLDMPEHDGLALQAALAGIADAPPVVFLTGRGRIPDSVMAMRAGAEDFITKLAPRADVIAAIRRAVARDTVERTRRGEYRARRKLFDQLTPREYEVLGHVLRGALNKQIAAALAMDERSVKRHRTSFMRKLGVDSVAALVKLAQAAGIVSPKGP